MKNVFKHVAVAVLGVVALISTPVFQSAAAEGYLDSQAHHENESIGEVTDAMGILYGHTGEFAEKLGTALGKAKDEGALTNMISALDKAGFEGGWAKQIGDLKAIGGACDALSKSFEILGYYKTAVELENAFDAGDRAAFQKIVADQITDFASSKLVDLFNKFAYTAGTKLVVASAAGGPVTLLVTAVGVVAVTLLLDKGIEIGVEKLMESETVRKWLLDFGGWLYDVLGGKQPSDDPFDDLPSGQKGQGGSSEHFQGLKPIKLIR